MADNTLVMGPDPSRPKVLLSWAESEKAIRAKNPMIAPEELDKAHAAWLTAARKVTGVEDPTPGPVSPSRDPTRPGTAAGAEQAGRALNPPKPPPTPAGSAFGDILSPITDFAYPAYHETAKFARSVERPFEKEGKRLEIGAEHAARSGAARALMAMGVPKAYAKKAGRAAEYPAAIPGQALAFVPQALAWKAAETAVPPLAAFDIPGAKRLPKAISWIPRTAAKGGVTGTIDELFRSETGEAPPPTASTLGKAAYLGGKGFVEYEAGERALRLLGRLGMRLGKASYQKGVDWWEGSKNRPKTENQGTLDQPTPPVRDEEQDPTFVKELNTEPTPPTAGKKEPAAPGLAAQNERTDKAGSGAGGTDPDDPGTHPHGGGPTSPSVPPGVAPGDIRESDAVKTDVPGPGTSEQFKPRQSGPVREHFKQQEEDRIAAQRAADDAAHTAEVGTRRLEEDPRNIEDYRRQLRGEPAETPAPRESRFRNIPRTLMDYLRNPRGYAETRAAAPGEPARRAPLPPAREPTTRRVVPPPGEFGPEPDYLESSGDPEMDRLFRQLRGEEPEVIQRNAPAAEGQGGPQSWLDAQRRERESEEASRQTQVEKERQAGERAELEQRIQNRKEREAAMGPMKVLGHLARDRERRALAALSGVEEPGIQWTGEMPSKERPYEGEGWRWEEPPRPKAPKEPPAPEPTEPEETGGESELERAREDEGRRARVAEEEEAARRAEEEARAAEEAEAAKKREPPKPPDADQLQRVVSNAADFLRGARGKDKGHYRRALRDAARALAEITSPAEAGKYIREEVGNGVVTKALDDILGEHLEVPKRPKTAAPGGRPGRGAKEAGKPTTSSVLPKDSFAIKLKDGRILHDPDAKSHAEVLLKHGAEADEVASTGFVGPDGGYRRQPGTEGFQKKTGEAKPLPPMDDRSRVYRDYRIEQEPDTEELSGRYTAYTPDGTRVGMRDTWADILRLVDDHLKDPERVAEEEAEAEEQEGEDYDPFAIRGRTGTLHVEGFENTPFVYEIVERRSPVTSHDTEGNPNPDYPEGIQQRALDREAYQATQREIRNNMDPARLGESPSAVEGAPILRAQDDVVLGGKQRMAALQSLEIGSDADETYQQWLWQNAEKFGIPQTELEEFEQPTLVRRLTRDLTPDEEQEFGPNTDVSPSMELSPSEKAQMDARRLSLAVLEKLDVTESGSLNTEGNLGFIRAFVAKLPRTERGGVVTDNGFLNDVGLRRVQNAVLARAYNVGKELHPAIVRMFESTDEKVKTIQHALLRAAPEFALYRADVDQGALEFVDVMTPLMDGASTVSALRNAHPRRTIQDWIDQADLGGKDRDLEKVMHLYRENTTVPDLTDALRYVATVLNQLPRKEAGDLIPREKAPTASQVFDMARDPDALEIDQDGEQRIADTIRELDADIRQARSVGDFEKAQRLEQQRKILTDEEPPC